MIRVDTLCKNYGDLAALEDVSFRADEGEIVGVLGLNGAGKSTLLRILAGELALSSGGVQVGGLDLATHPREIRALVGYLPEGAPVYQDMRVRAFLTYMARLNGAPKRGLEARIDAVAELTHIGHQLDRVIGELSLGYRKRVGIAQAVLHEPRVVILDEPVSALDPAEIVGMRRLVRSLGGKHTVLVSSHILSEVHETCDRLLVLHEGRLVAEGSEAELNARLAGSDRLELTLRGAEEAIRAALPEGVEVDSIETLEDPVRRLRVQLDASPDDADPREALVAALVHAGIGVRAVVERRTDLEGLFLSVVEDPRPDATRGPDA